MNRGLTFLRLKNVFSKQKRLCTTEDVNQGQDSKQFVPNPDVPGLSAKVVKIPGGEVGPGASKSGVYKNVEYFCYDSMSFYDANIELSGFRLPQPSPFKNKEKK